MMIKRDVLQEGVVAGIFVTVTFLFFRLYYLGVFPSETLSFWGTPADSFVSYLDKPAALACFLGDTLRSGFVSTTVAAILVTLLFLLEWRILVRILHRFKIGEIALLYAFFPIVFEWIFYQQASGSLDATFTVIILLLLFWIYTKVPGRWTSLALGFSLLPFIFVLVGGRMVVFSLMVLLYEAEMKRNRWMYWMVLLIMSHVVLVLGIEVYSLPEEMAFLYPYSSIRALLPTIMVMFGLLALQTRIFREIKINWKSTLVILLLLFFILGAGIEKQRREFKQIRLFPTVHAKRVVPDPYPPAYQYRWFLVG